MKETIPLMGQEVTLATVTVGILETIELEGKRGRQFNIAFIAASLLAAGDKERGSEAWVRTVPVFDETGENKPPFDALMKAANNVNGFKTPTADTKPGEGEPAAPAA